MHRRPRQRLPERRIGMNERRAGNVKSHHLHHHLVRVRRPVECTGPGRMIARRLARQQFVAANLSFGEQLPDPLLFLVRQPARHRPRRNQQRRQMPEAQCPDQQPRNDLVANPEHRDRVEHAVRQCDRRPHRDVVAAEQRQVHPVLPLRHPVAHRRHPARDLRRRADLAGENLDLLGIAAIGLVRRQHVVERRHDADIRPGDRLDRGLVVPRRGKPVGKIAARQPWAP